MASVAPAAGWWTWSASAWDIGHLFTDEACKLAQRRRAVLLAFHRAEIRRPRLPAGSCLPLPHQLSEFFLVSLRPLGLCLGRRKIRGPRIECEHPEAEQVDNRYQGEDGNPRSNPHPFEYPRNGYNDGGDISAI